MIDPSRSEKLGERGAKYREAFIRGMATKYGGRPSTARPISHERELELYRLPTSPAAVEAFNAGATIEQAEEANRLWASEMRTTADGIRQQMQQARAKDSEIAAALQQQGVTDDQIFAACRKHAYELGKQAAKDDPAREVEYHARQTDKLIRARLAPTYTAVEGAV